MKKYILFTILIILLGGFWFYRQSNEFVLPEGESAPFVFENISEKSSVISSDKFTAEIKENKKEVMKSTRQIFITDGVKHSVPLDEILGGGPPKDGIPSIDEPNFVSADNAEEFLNDDSVGLGIFLNSEARFYPYQILVWHEIVNDSIGGTPILVSYCPLCATAIVFDPTVGGEVQEFVTSGKLWQSNLVMYNRTGDEDTESLWSQILGEAILGEATGEKLAIIPADTIKLGQWKSRYPDTKVLSRDTGAIRAYGVDPYGDYYTSAGTIFPTDADGDDRLHPKTLVIGVEINGKFKAYEKDKLVVGETIDTVGAGNEITITKNETGQIRVVDNSTGEQVSLVAGFWFAWLAIHPETELYK